MTGGICCVGLVINEFAEETEEPVEEFVFLLSLLVCVFGVVFAAGG